MATWSDRVRDRLNRLQDRVVAFEQDAQRIRLLGCQQPVQCALAGCCGVPGDERTGQPSQLAP